MSEGNYGLTEKDLLISDKIKSKLFREGFATETTGQHPDGPRGVRRNKLLSSGESIKGKTCKLRKKYRNVGNTKTLVASK